MGDGRGTPAPVQQDPLFYPHGTKWMAPGPVGQTYSLPDDEGLKKHLTKVAENYHKVYKMYNLPWDEGNNSLLADPEMKKAQAFWPEEFFQEGPNSAWWYKNVLYPLEKKVEEDVKYHTEQDQQEYRKKGKNALKRNWLDRSKSMIDAFFSKKSWEVRTKEDAEKFEMVKDFVKDCDDIGFMSSWKLTETMKKASEDRNKDIKRVQSSSKDKKFKKQELLFTMDDLHKNFDAYTPRERREKGMQVIQDITDYGFLKEFTKDGAKAPVKAEPKRILNPILDPIDISKLSPSEKRRWEKVLDYLYNDLPEDDEVFMKALTEEQKEFVSKYKAQAEPRRPARAATPPVASLSIGLTRFSFALNRQMSALAKRATRKHFFGNRA